MQTLSKLISKTRKQIPADETSLNAQFLTKAGFIYKEMAGVYAYLPLGLRVIEKIKNIVREEMNNIGGQEIIMTSLQRKELWEITDRWSDKNVDIWFKSKLKSNTEVGLAWSHEEPITEMMKEYISSYKDLPAYVYQFQTKLRNETRAKSGIMRGREFVMKDLYSYSLTKEEHEEFYNLVKQAYLKIFERVGLGDKTFFTFASGGAFTKFSHEFQTICEAGEDTVYLDRQKGIAINEEVFTDEIVRDLNLDKNRLEKVTTSEVGNIFTFGSEKCDKMGLFITSEDGKQGHVFLGSYGIGITRLMGVIAEIFNDNKGLIWPKAISPYDIHFVSLGAELNEKAVEIIKNLEGTGLEVLFDDREVSAGEKFADADLIGIPIRVVLSKKTMEQRSVEVKMRSSEKAELVKIEKILDFLKSC